MSQIYLLLQLNANLSKYDKILKVEKSLTTGNKENQCEQKTLKRRLLSSGST